MTPPFELTPPDIVKDTVTPRQRWGWSSVASIALHATLLAVILFGFSFDMPEAAKEDSISVDLVPPPEKKEVKKEEKNKQKEAEPVAKQQRVTQPEKETGQKPVQETTEDKPKAEPAQPQAFESADKGEDKPVEAEKPAVERALPQARTSSQTQTSSGQAKDSDPSEQAARMKADILRQENGQVAASDKDASKATGDEKPQETKADMTAGKADGKDAKTASQPQPQAALTEAKTLFSKNSISDPRVAKALGQLPPNRRLVQICSIETLEQIRHSHADSFPDLLVPFSTGRGLISGTVLDASGGAYRSMGKWYEVAFRCEANADVSAIVSFRFNIGQAIPRSAWQGRELPAQ